MAHPYRAPIAGHPRLWLVRLDRCLPLREFRWFRRPVGGVWLRLWAHLLPAGGVEFWHHEGVDEPVLMSTKVLAREVWS